MKKRNIAVVGSGSWGTSISVLLEKNCHNITLWSWKEEESRALSENKENKEFLPGVQFNENIVCSHNMSECVSEADLVITAVPSFATRNTAKELSKYVKPGQKHTAKN